MELYVFCLVALMILTTLVFKGILCGMFCFHPFPGQTSRCPTFQMAPNPDHTFEKVPPTVEIPLDLLEVEEIWKSTSTPETKVRTEEILYKKSSQTDV